MLVDDLIKIVHKINDEGKGILLVYQDVQVALENSDRSYVIENGRIALAGKSGDLLNNPEVKKSYMGI